MILCVVSIFNMHFEMPVRQRQTSSMFMVELRKELKELLENPELLCLVQQNISFIVCQTSGSKSLRSALKMLITRRIYLELIFMNMSSMT